MPLRAIAHERRGQVRNVFAPIAKRRQRQLDDVEAVEQVVAEASGRDLGAQIAVGRGDDARRRRLRGSSEPTRCTSPYSSDAQQLGLHRERQLADLVEEQRAAVGGFEQPRLRVRRRR